MNGRECGGCTACCTVFAIEELKKPARVKCEHECEIGCAIYESRPQSCINFMCTWIRGFGNDNHRPDRLGIFVEERMTDELGHAFFVKEVWPGAVKSEEVVNHLTHLRVASGRPVYILNSTMEAVIGEVLTPGEAKSRARKARAKRRKKN